MKLQQKLTGVTAVVLSFLGLAVAPAYATAGDTGPFSVQAALLTPSRVTLGEPILVRYTLMNASSQNVVTHLGIYGTDWYTLTLRDAQGSFVTPITDLRPLHPQGSHSSKSGFFRGGGSDIDYIPVTKRLRIEHPGQYTLTIHAKLPYVMDDALTEGTSEALAASSGLVQTQDITFPILVVPADPVRLKNTAEALQKAAVNVQNVQLALANMDSLFSMPEAQAAASWRSLAMKPSFFTDPVVGELADLRSTTGVDILSEMLDNPALTRDSISVSLNRIYNTASPALREHVKEVARKHGFEMPEVAGTPYAPKDEAPASGGISF